MIKVGTQTGANVRVVLPGTNLNGSTGRIVAIEEGEFVVMYDDGGDYETFAPHELEEL